MIERLVYPDNQQFSEIIGLIVKKNVSAQVRQCWFLEYCYFTCVHFFGLWCLGFWLVSNQPKSKASSRLFEGPHFEWATILQNAAIKVPQQRLRLTLYSLNVTADSK